MADLKFKPVPHYPEAFLAKARARKGFPAACEALELEYRVASQMLRARSCGGLTQDNVAERMGTPKSAISRLESAGKHTPSLAPVKRYASAVGTESSSAA
jgi:DNA-binding XRE family transcriptional regulator